MQEEKQKYKVKEAKEEDWVTWKGRETVTCWSRKEEEEEEED